MKKRALLSSLMILVLCITLMSGATFALFTSESTTSITVSSGKVSVETELSDLKTYSLGVEQAAGTFENGGTAELDAAQGTVVLTNITPGDKATFKLVVNNKSNVSIKYYVRYSVDGELAKGLSIKETENGATKDVVSEFSPAWVLVNAAGKLHEKEISIELPLDAGNEYQEKEMAIQITVYAVQGNAEDQVVVNSAKELEFALNEGQDVKLGSDITIDETIVINAPAANTNPRKRAVKEATPVVIDLNGKTINVGYEEGSTTKHIYAFTNKGNLVITGNGTINARGIFNYGNLTLENATINAIDGDGGYAVRNYEGSTFVMNGGLLATTLEDDHKVNLGGYDATTVRVDAGAKFELNNGEINNICDWTYAIDSQGETIINGGKVTSIHSTISTYDKLTINGGEFVCNGLEGVTAHVLIAWSGETIVNGGTFDGKDNFNGFNIDTDAGAVVNVKGGEFLPVHSGSLYGEGVINVSGGVFFDNVNSRVVEGFSACQNAEGKWEIKSNAVILAEKLAQGGTVKLEDNLVVADPIYVAEGVEAVLDLNGKTITGTMHKSVGAVVKNDGSLKVVNGTLKSTANNGGSAIVNNGSAELINVTLNGAPNADDSWPAYTINNTGAMTLNGCLITSYHGALASYGEAAVATLDDCEIDMVGIKGFTSHGFYTYSGGKVVVNSGVYANKADDQNATGGSVINGVVEINGGTFTGRIENYYGNPVIKGGTFSVNPSKYVVEGYVAQQDTETGLYTIYRIVYTFEELQEALNNGENVTLGGNIDLNDSIVIPGN